MANTDREATPHSGHIPWTTTHAFYALIGGFAIDTGALSEEQKFLPCKRGRLTLTLAGLKFLARERPDLILLVPKEEIRDKSKAYMFAKSIITIQASFSVIQCIYRLVWQLPISLLELNTLAHTLYALLSFVFWWKKLLEVAKPTTISANESKESWAALCFMSKVCKGNIMDSRFFEQYDGKIRTRSRPENSSTQLQIRVGDTFGNLRCRRIPTWDYWVYTP